MIHIATILIVDNSVSCYYRILLAYEALCPTNNIAPLSAKAPVSEEGELTKARVA